LHHRDPQPILSRLSPFPAHPAAPIIKTDPQLHPVEVVVAYKCVIVLLTLLMIVSSPALAQTPRLPSAQQPFPPDQTAPSPEDEAKTKLERDMAKKANQDRQVALKRDTDKLLKLATELKEYVDKTNENMLSLNVIKKADEIEKLAHSVKDKMKGN
jgi:hypothetical protein